MALLINAADPLGSANANTIDNNLRTLKTAIEDIFGVPDNTTIGAEGFTFNSGGLRRLRFQDAAGDPGTAGFLQRNATLLKWHDATAARTIYTAGGTDVAVADGGTGISSGTSGGILAFTGSTTLASSAALTANGLVFGGGAGVAPGSTSALTNGQLPVGRSSNSPTGAAITAGTNASITNGSGSITVAATDRSVLAFGNSSTLVVSGLSNFAAYIGPGPGGAEAGVTCPAGSTGTLVACYVRATDVAGNAYTATITPRINGSDVAAFAVVLNLSGSSESSGSATGSVSVSANDLVCMKFLTSAADYSVRVRAVLVIRPTS